MKKIIIPILVMFCLVPTVFGVVSPGGACFLKDTTTIGDGSSAKFIHNILFYNDKVVTFQQNRVSFFDIDPFIEINYIWEGSNLFAGGMIDDPIIGIPKLFVSYNYKLYIYDISNLLAPSRLIDWTFTCGLETAVINPYEFAVGGDFVFFSPIFTAPECKGVYAVDISTPSTPVNVGMYNTAFTVQSLVYYNDILYVGGSEGNLLSLDVTTKSDITLIDNLPFVGGSVQDMVGIVNGDFYLFANIANLLGNDWLVKSDSNGFMTKMNTNHVLQGSFTTMGNNIIQLVNNYIYTSCLFDGGGFTYGVNAVYDISNIESPVFKGTNNFVVPPKIFAVSSNNQYIVTANNSDTLNELLLYDCDNSYPSFVSGIQPYSVNQFEKLNFSIEVSDTDLPFGDSLFVNIENSIITPVWNNETVFNFSVDTTTPGIYPIDVSVNDSGNLITTDSFNVEVVCVPVWVEEWGDCEITDTQSLFNVDTNCGSEPILLDTWACDFCEPLSADGVWTDWVDDGVCQLDDTQLQNKNMTTIDSNDCFAQTGLPTDDFVGVTSWDFQTIACDNCTPLPTNTTWGDGIDVDVCLVNNTKVQVINLTTYDGANCFAKTGLESDVFVEETHFDFQSIPCNFGDEVSFVGDEPVDLSDPSQVFEGVLDVVLKQGGNVVVEFYHDFDSNPIDFSEITLDAFGNGVNKGYVLVAGIPLAGGETKSFTLVDVDPNLAWVCIKDIEMTDISEISPSCTELNEDRVHCDGGVTDKGYACTPVDDGLGNTDYVISGLRHSGVIQTDAPIVTPPSSSGGGGGSSTPPVVIVPPCNPELVCGSWEGVCYGGVEYRFCLSECGEELTDMRSCEQVFEPSMVWVEEIVDSDEDVDNDPVFGSIVPIPDEKEGKGGLLKWGLIVSFVLIGVAGSVQIVNRSRKCRSSRKLSKSNKTKERNKS